MTALESEPHRLAADDEGTWAGLCEAVTELARTVPGPLRRLSLRLGDAAVDVEFAPAPEPPHEGTVVPAVAPAPAPAPPAAPPAPAAGVVVRSPLVGTFYVAPVPGADPFVRVGDVVEAGQEVAIVEAMKLMNRVVTDVAGTVAEVCVADGGSVEYDQPLVVVVPREP
jgi:acetyl-CoA carboxylase biotin carboxyl carrier protein